MYLDEHAVGRVRGGLNTKAHAVVDGRRCRWLSPSRPARPGTSRPCRSCSDLDRATVVRCRGLFASRHLPDAWLTRTVVVAEG
jgi:hypothetical protein